MFTNRMTATIAGALYIIGTVAGILSVIAIGSALDAPSTPAMISANANQLIFGALLVLTMALALSMVPVMLYPILKKHNPVLALGYVVFRGALETISYLILVICWLAPVSALRTFMQAGAAADSTFQSASAWLLSIGKTSVPLGEIVFSLGALMLYVVLFQSRLIPRWISGWGVGAVGCYLAAAFLDIFGLADPKSALASLLFVPMMIQEMVMAAWFIVKGFDPAAAAFEPSRERTAMPSNWRTAR